MARFYPIRAALPRASVAPIWVVGTLGAILALGCRSESPSTGSTPANPSPTVTAVHGEESSVESGNQPDSSTEELSRILASPVELELRDAPLRDALALISKVESIEFEVDDHALRTAGISDDVSVTLSASGVPLSEALRSALEPLGLIYVVRGERITVTAVGSDATSPE